MEADTANSTISADYTLPPDIKGPLLVEFLATNGMQTADITDVRILTSKM